MQLYFFYGDIESKTSQNLENVALIKSGKTSHMLYFFKSNNAIFITSIYLIIYIYNTIV